MARLKRLVKDTPEGLEVYVGETVAVLARGPNEEHFRRCHRLLQQQPLGRGSLVTPLRPRCGLAMLEGGQRTPS